MKFFKNKKQNFIFLYYLFLILTCSICSATDSPIQVQIEPSEVGVGGSFELIVRIRGSNVGEPDIEFPEGVKILPNPIYSGISTEVSITFGQPKIIMTKERHYRGIANKEGEWTISVIANVDGKQQKSDDVVLKVTATGSAPPATPQTPTTPQITPRNPFGRRGQSLPPGQKTNPEIDKILKVEGEIPKKIVYQGEILNLIFRAKILESYNFSVKTSTGNIPELPELEGFYVGKIQQNKRRETTPDGTYNIIELIVPICPKSVGTLTISPWVWDDCYVQYNTWGWPETYAIVKNSDPIQLEVKPIPTPTENYFGAIGTYTLTSNLSQTEVKVGTPVYLSITLRGDGYPDFLRPPKKPELDWAYVSEPEITSGNTDTWNNVEKTFRFSITPMKAGNYQIPSISYDYFDPLQEKYNTLLTQPYSIKVIGEAIDKNNLVIAGGTPRLQTKTVDISNSDLLPIITEGVNLNPVNPYNSAIYYSLLVLSPILSILSIGVGFRREYLRNNPLYRRRIFAYENCLSKYNDLRNKGNIPSAIEQALKQYIGDVCGVDNTSGLTSDDIEKILTEQGLDIMIKERVSKVLKTCERIRYSGATVNENENKGLEEGFQSLLEELRTLLK